VGVLPPRADPFAPAPLPSTLPLGPPLPPPPLLLAVGSAALETAFAPSGDSLAGVVDGFTGDECPLPWMPPPSLSSLAPSSVGTAETPVRLRGSLALPLPAGKLCVERGPDLGTSVSSLTAHKATHRGRHNRGTGTSLE
jgi:hypothetical protein